MDSTKNKSTVLIVDDTSENIDVLRGILKNTYKTQVAKNGLNALKIINSIHKPDLILLDIMMPDMDGYEVCRQIKSHPLTKDIPVIFITAKNEINDEKLGFDLGAVDYITKPVRPALVLRRVQAHLESYNQKKKIADLLEQTQQSIQFASLIQNAIIPDTTPLEALVKEYFTIWLPKDVVGGDIFLFETLRNNHEFLLMVIDCTGHGVPGAFITMLVKALERQITSLIINRDEYISPANIMSFFNRSMKDILKQESSLSINNAGFDGGILYFNKDKNILKYSGSQTPLFIIKNGELDVIKGDRHSVGYKNSDPSFQFKEHQIMVSEGMKVYLTTDGFLDQNGGEKEFPYGRKRFNNMLLKNKDKSISEQKTIFLEELEKYQGDHERNDDITMIGLKF
ncbi:MAG: response regulator [Gammaproteobacteria bacterium]|nr:response regulator [Gammaproteobacteria bacterium]